LRAFAGSFSQRQVRRPRSIIIIGSLRFHQDRPGLFTDTVLVPIIQFDFQFPYALP
jgi:hypothetical protein